MLRCRDGEVVGGAATAALWALCRVPVNRKHFAKTRCALLLSGLKFHKPECHEIVRK